jgi:hypothetical protein
MYMTRLLVFCDKLIEKKRLMNLVQLLANYLLTHLIDCFSSFLKLSFSKVGTSWPL